MQIRCRHNYSFYTLDEDNPIPAHRIIGNAVLVERDIYEVYMPFGGFISDNNLEVQEPQKANLLNIEAFKSDGGATSGWIEIPTVGKQYTC